MCPRSPTTLVVTFQFAALSHLWAYIFTPLPPPPSGVLNTDNMSILGLTIDYGPYGFMDNFDPRYTPNITDFSGRRYCYQNQPGAAQ